MGRDLGMGAGLAVGVGVDIGVAVAVALGVDVAVGRLGQQRGGPHLLDDVLWKGVRPDRELDATCSVSRQTLECDSGAGEDRRTMHDVGAGVGQQLKVVLAA